MLLFMLLMEGSRIVSQVVAEEAMVLHRLTLPLGLPGACQFRRPDLFVSPRLHAKLSIEANDKTQAKVKANANASV